LCFGAAAGAALDSSATVPKAIVRMVGIRRRSSRGLIRSGGRLWAGRHFLEIWITAAVRSPGRAAPYLLSLNWPHDIRIALLLAAGLMPRQFVGLSGKFAMRPVHKGVARHAWRLHVWAFPMSGVPHVWCPHVPLFQRAGVSNVCARTGSRRYRTDEPQAADLPAKPRNKPPSAEEISDNRMGRGVSSASPIFYRGRTAMKNRWAAEQGRTRARLKAQAESSVRTCSSSGN